MATRNSQSNYVDMNESRDDYRPHKRRRVAETAPGPTYQQVVLEELDVELGLRQRLLETVNSRLTWALLLREALNEGSDCCSVESHDFQAVALDALRASEEPSRLLFDREVFPLERPVASMQSKSPMSVFSDTQHSSRISSSRARGIPRVPPQPAKKLLFLRNTHADPPEVAKLACLDCARSDFSNLQGLLNHCRIRHGREFGSHDECIQSCAVIVPEEEQDGIIASGTELSGVSLPSLRRLFEIAVGAGDSVGIPRARKEVGQVSVVDADIVKREELPETSIGVSTALGVHKDSPALAPFLGREPKKRVVNVYDSSEEVLDILGDNAIPTNSLIAKKGWRKPYSHRNIARAELDEIHAEPVEPANAQSEETQLRTSVTGAGSPVGGIVSSRFHIVARVKVADWSLWLRPERPRADRPEHTHRWRLTVSSPSYSLHITTFLEKLTVTCLSDPPPSTLNSPIVVTAPPFAVTSTTDRPFLARLTFTWTGSVNVPMEIEHWVDVDPLHLGHPILGEEQVFDIELDRNTQLLPAREDVRKLTWKDEGGRDNDHDKLTTEKIDRSACDDGRGIGTVLRALLEEVPITVRDARSRRQSAPIFALVPTVAHYRNLIPGRRKAIELSRARALLAAYRAHMASIQFSAPYSLTIADVYGWMEEEMLFPRAAPASDVITDSQPGKTTDTHQVPEAYCRFCGLQQIFHSGVKTEASTSEDVSLYTASCTESKLAANGLPLLDVKRILRQYPAELLELPCGLSDELWTIRDGEVKPKTISSSADLVAITNPGLLSAIRELATHWRLTNLEAPIRPLHGTRGLVSRAPVSCARQEQLDGLAPYALLAAVTGCMVRLLVRSGLDAVRRDESAHRRLSRLEGTSRTIGKAEMGGGRRFLTPSHILRGITINASRGLAESAALVCLARLGMARSDAQARMATGSPPAMGIEDAARVKEDREEDA